MKRTFLLISAVGILIGTGSCYKRIVDNPPPYSGHQDYFNARFNNYFSPGETGLRIFLSDVSGNLLAEASLEGENSAYLTPVNGTLFPDRLVETLVYKGPVSGGKSTVYLYTYLMISPADWTWTTFESDSTGSANLHFSNIPALTAYGISSKFHWIHGDVMPASVSIGLGKNPDNVYILLNTATSGTRYKWLTGVGNGNNYPVDLSSTDPTLSKTIPMPAAWNLSYRLSGYLPSGEHSKGLYTLDYGDKTGTYTDSITLHYPETLFADFEFYINALDPSNPRKQWYQYQFGTIPDRTDHLAGNIVVLDSTPAHYRVQTSGTFERLGSTWECNPVGPYRYQWTVYGPPSSTSFAFPDLPVDLANSFTGFNISSLKLSSAEIKEFSGITSYDDLISKMFVSGNYIANIVPEYSGMIYYMSTAKKGNKPAGEKEF